MGNNWVQCFLSVGACGCVSQFLKGRSKQSGVLTVTAACGSVFQHVHNMQSSTQQQNMPFSSTSTSHTSSTSTFGSRMMWSVGLDSHSAPWESGLAWVWVKFHHQWWVNFVMCCLLMTSVQAVCGLEGWKLYERAACVQALCWPGSPRKPAQCQWQLQTREQMGRIVFRHPLTSLWGDYGALCRSVIGHWTTYRTWPWPPEQHTGLGPGLLNSIQDVALASCWPPWHASGCLQRSREKSSPADLDSSDTSMKCLTVNSTGESLGVKQHWGHGLGHLLTFMVPSRGHFWWLPVEIMR